MSLVRLFAVLALAALPLAGCGMFDKAPGASVVRLHNNSGRTVLVANEELRRSRNATVPFPDDPDRPLILYWGGCVHIFVADSKPPDIRDVDWLLRGAYLLQLEPDGRLYGVPDGQRLPADVAKLTQPQGYPLQPREGSSCVQ
jgi:hypothetical protein